jgi:HSP20 family protein
MADDAREVQKKEAETPKGIEPTRPRRIYTPNVDIIEGEEEIMVIADMPGIDEKSVDVVLEKNVLEIYGRVDPEIPDHHKLAVSEYGIGDYLRAFTLSDEVDKERIQASVKNGVLRLVLPKVQAAKTRKIQVKAEV